MSGYYKKYFTSADCNVYFTNIQDNKQIHIDEAAAIGFNNSVSRVPIYGLGQTLFNFVSRGNILVTGQLNLNFVSDEYLKAAINYVYNKTDNTARLTQLRDRLKNNTTASVKLTREEWAELALLENLQKEALTKDISSMYDPINIQIVFDNTDTSKSSTPKTIVLEHVIFTNHTNSVQQSDSIVGDGYQFIAKNIRGT